MPTGDLAALIRLSAALAAGGDEPLRAAMTGCLHLREEGEPEEVILQSYLFLGYPRALNAFALWREVSGRGPPTPVDDAWGDWSQRGKEVCKAVYSGQYEDLRANVRRLHPDMERWMVVEGYGKVLGRPGLSLRGRELCIVALLAVLGAPRQLHSHLRGALNTGATLAEIDLALRMAREVAGGERDAEAQAVWSRVRARWMENPDRGGIWGEGTS